MTTRDSDRQHDDHTIEDVEASDIAADSDPQPTESYSFLANHIRLRGDEDTCRCSCKRNGRMADGKPAWCGKKAS